MPHKHRLSVCVIISSQNCYIINFSFIFLNCNKYVENSLHRRKFSFHSSSQVKFRWRDTWRSIIASNGHLTIDVSVDQINDLSYSLRKRIKQISTCSYIVSIKHKSVIISYFCYNIFNSALRAYMCITIFPYLQNMLVGFCGKELGHPIYRCTVTLNYS